MSLIEITSSTGVYKIEIMTSRNLICEPVDFLVVDSNVPKQLWPEAKFVYELEATETVKNLETVENLVLKMVEAGLTRQSTVHAVGGGVVQDIATLACSLYMRGVDWAYWPTTLTGMLDSCVGGKSSINVGSHKNLVGNFHPPKKIFIDPRFLGSLPIEHYLSGLAEGVKICFARGEKPFNDFLRNPASQDTSLIAPVAELIGLCLNSKKWFVEADEFDKNERQLLNFGHSFGHALESASQFKIPHGLAVALGMLAAVDFANAANFAAAAKLRTYCLSLLRTWPGRKAALSTIDWSVFESSLSADKKNSTTHLRLVVPLQTSSLSLESYSYDAGSLVKATASMKTIISGVAHEVL